MRKNSCPISCVDISTDNFVYLCLQNLLWLQNSLLLTYTPRNPFSLSVAEQFPLCGSSSNGSRAHSAAVFSLPLNVRSHLVHAAGENINRGTASSIRQLGGIRVFVYLFAKVCLFFDIFVRVLFSSFIEWTDLLLKYVITTYYFCFFGLLFCKSDDKFLKGLRWKIVLIIRFLLNMTFILRVTGCARILSVLLNNLTKIIIVRRSYWLYSCMHELDGNKQHVTCVRIWSKVEKNIDLFWPLSSTFNVAQSVFAGFNYKLNFDFHFY